MTKVRYYDDENFFSITFSGHAGYAESGKDIVCAGISVPASELILASRNALDRGEIEALYYSAESGKVKLQFRYAGGGAIREVIALILECLRSVATQYSQHLAVIKMHSNSNV